VDKFEKDWQNILDNYDWGNATVKCDRENNPISLLKEKKMRVDILVPHKGIKGQWFSTHKIIE